MQFPDKSPTNRIVQAATTLTTSYVAGTIISGGEYNALCLLVTYTKGSETSMQIKVEATNDPVPATGSAWYQQVTQTTSGGTVTLTPAIYSMTAASAATVQPYTIIINPVKAQGYRVSVQYTGGSNPGTVGIQAFMAWV